MNTTATLRRYFFPALLSVLLLTFLAPGTGTATTSPNSGTGIAAGSTFTGRLTPASIAHPTPKRVYLVTAEHAPHPSGLSRPNGYFTVVFSDHSTFRFATCATETSRNCVWPADRVGNRRGRSFVDFRGTLRPFPTRMLHLPQPRG